LSRRGERPTAETLATLPVAIDAMGGDKSPGEIVEGARRAHAEHGIPVVLVGPPEQVGDTMGLPLVACTEVIAMDEDPAGGVRRKKDSSLVRAAELVRDGQASAMVSAGNTGATMAAALLRMGRLPGVIRPCIATPLPRLGRSPAVLVDAGANAECTAAMLVQFAQMGAAYVAARFATESPSVGLLSIGEEPTKGTPLVKETHGLLAHQAALAGLAAESGATGGAGFAFLGNLEGRDLLPSPADVIVTDGFTGNVALKALEGTLRFIFDVVTGVFGIDDETKAAADVLLPHLLPLAAEFEPENTGGAMLLGIDGVCVISHGSSNATAMVNAVRVAYECATRGLADHVATAVRPPQEG
jgi:glycerol-3-phosphate acyltransferase PlsX